MEDGREVITIDVIKRDLMKNYLLLLPITPLPFGLFYGIFALFQQIFIGELLWDILKICAIIAGLVFIVNIIIAIIKLQKGTLLTITTDVLVSKQDHMWDPRWRTNVDRLYFQNAHYDIAPKDRIRYCEPYRMELGAVFSTAFVGDSFTLIKVRKRVYYAYNNKLFDVQVP